MTENVVSENLIKILADSFPQFKFPQVHYEERTEVDGKISYFAKIKLLGQVFSSGPQVSQKAALDEVCSLAYEVIKEFRHLVLLQTDSSLGCESLSSLIAPLKEEANQVAQSLTQTALRSVSAINNRLIEVENEKMNLKVKAKNDKIIGQMQTSVTSETPEPVKMPKLDHTLIIDEKSSVSRSSEAADVKLQKSVKIKEPSTQSTEFSEQQTESSIIRLSPLKISEESPIVRDRKTNIGAPIPAFYEYVEKQSSSEPIVFDDFTKGPYFGCRLRWGKKVWVAPAEHRQKKDAHNLAAVMACVELFGEGFVYEGVDPRIYVKFTRESVRKLAEKYVFAMSDELLAGHSNAFDDSTDVTNLKVEPLADGRKFTSLVNEICQKMRFTPPNYQVSSVNALTNYYVCTVKNFYNFPQIESLPFTKKNEAKEDSAGRIYHLLKQKGIIDEANRIISRQKAYELSNQSTHTHDREYKRNNVSPPPVIPQQSFNVPPATMAPPVQPPGNMNMNTMQMFPMFMMSQMSQQSQMQGAAPFDQQMMKNFEEMMKQWQAFLAWQQQQQQQSVPNGLQQSTQQQSQDQQYHGQHYQGHQYQGQQHQRDQHQQRDLHYQGEQHQQYHHNANMSRHGYPASNQRNPQNHSNYNNNRDERQEPQDPRRNGDSYSRKRNYEESRRRYYDQ